jgi:hypothetical protein
VTPLGVDGDLVVPVGMPFCEKPPMISSGCQRVTFASEKRFVEATTSGAFTGR